MTTAPLIRTAVDDCARRPVQHMDVDVSEVGCCDVSGLNVFLESVRLAAERGCRLRLRQPTRQIRRLLDVTATTDVLLCPSAAFTRERLTMVLASPPTRQPVRPTEAG